MELGYKKILEISHKEFEVAGAETETEEQGTVATVGDTPDVQVGRAQAVKEVPGRMEQVFKKRRRMTMTKLAAQNTKVTSWLTREKYDKRQEENNMLLENEEDMPTLEDPEVILRREKAKELSRVAKIEFVCRQIL